MGLLDIALETSETLINRQMIVAHDCLNFDPMPSLPATHFRKDIFIDGDQVRGFCIALMELPMDFQEGYEIEIRIAFLDFHKKIDGNRWALIPKGTIKPLSYRGSIYEYIQMFLSKDNLKMHILKEI